MCVVDWDKLRIKRSGVTREEVIRFYTKYDCSKKKREPPSDIDAWPWDDPDRLGQKLVQCKFKKDVLTAYRTWKLAEFSVVDLLECAIFNGIFPGEPRALGQLVLRGKLAEWMPDRGPAWWADIGSGSELDAESALIVRPALMSERPAKWYIEDGSGRALALLQRIFRYSETGRTAWVYVGDEPDRQSDFITENPELICTC